MVERTICYPLTPLTPHLWGVFDGCSVAAPLAHCPGVSWHLKNQERMMFRSPGPILRHMATNLCWILCTQNLKSGPGKVQEKVKILW